MMRFAGHHFLWLTIWMSTPVLLHYFFEIDWIFIPWLPVSVIGTAVAFYVGFKNNQSYDRLWEARKIWGGIVNSSRSWGSAVKGFVGNEWNKEVSQSSVDQSVSKLFHAHIGWLYQLRMQLLEPTPWEHVALRNPIMKNLIRKRQKRFGLGLVEDQEIGDLMFDCKYDPAYKKISEASNKATAIIDSQAQKLKEVRSKGMINDFAHMELQKLLHEFYGHQGKCERIKKFPLPRQYANMSNIFIGLFLFLLPLASVMQFEAFGDYGLWTSIFINVIVGWIFIVMELVGDYSENPFGGLGNDIPMLSLCRTIEIDLREMQEEEVIPPPIKAVNGVLM